MNVILCGRRVFAVVVQSSVVSDSLQSHRLQHARLPFSISQSLLKLTSIDSVKPCNHLLLSHTLLLLLSTFPSIEVFSNESAFHNRWPEYWSFSFSISPSSEYSELISFRIDWFDLHAVQGTLKFSLKLYCQEENDSIHDITTRQK